MSFEIRPVRQNGQKLWGVFQGDRKVGHLTPTRDTAETQLESFLRRQRAVQTAHSRPCMCCRAPFLSEGPHNRLCDKCRTQSE